MQTLSALDAISPAFARTKLVLFSPFRKGRTWKLAATGYLARIGTFFLPFPLIYLAFVPVAHKAGGSFAAWAVIIAVLVFTAIYLVIFYLCSRLGFVFFDVVLNRGEFVAPAWRKYGLQTFKWTLFKVLSGTLLLGVLALPAAGYLRHFSSVFTSFTATPGQPPSPQFIHAMFTAYAAFFVLYFVVGLAYFATSLLADFIVPSLALEDTTLGEAFRRFGQFLSNEPGQLTLYAVLKLGLGLAFYLGGIIAFEIVFVVAILILGGIALVLGYLLHLIGVSWVILTVFGILLAILAYGFFLFYGLFLLLGTIMTFLEAYTLYFLGGRYPLLGELLDRSTPAPLVYYAPPPSYPPPPLA